MESDVSARVRIGRVCGVDFAVDGRHRQLRGQVILRGVDRLLNILLRDIDIEAQIELQRDDGGAGGARVESI